MNPFYRTLAPVYDELFPVDDTVLDFLVSSIPDRSFPVVDVACGTGAYTQALASRGLHVVGIDSDEAMVETATRARRLRQGSVILKRDMRRVHEIERAPFAALFCIGNSISHLPTVADFERALSSFARALTGAGVIVLQTVDMGSIAVGEWRQLPDLEGPSCRFQRRYERTSATHTRFAGRLTRKATGESFPIEQQLVHLDSRWFKDALERHGFHDVDVYGGFDRESPQRRDVVDSRLCGDSTIP